MKPVLGRSRGGARRQKNLLIGRKRKHGRVQKRNEGGWLSGDWEEEKSDTRGGVVKSTAAPTGGKGKRYNNNKRRGEGECTKYP